MQSKARKKEIIGVKNRSGFGVYESGSQLLFGKLCCYCCCCRVLAGCYLPAGRLLSAGCPAGLGWGWLAVSK
jgi:hypothetical protein